MRDKAPGPLWRVISSIGWLLLIGLAAGGIYFFVLSDNFHRVGRSEVYRSALLAPDALQRRIDSLGIRSVVNLVGRHPEEPWYPAQVRLLEKAGVAFRSFDFEEFKLPGRSRLLSLLQALEGLPHPLLVHCNRGADRTGMAALMLRLLEPETTLEEARLEVSLQRRAFFPDSVGKQLYRQYAHWLGGRGEAHSPKRFRSFLTEHYRDDVDHLEYGLTFVDGQLLETFEDGTARVSAGKPVTLSGWSFDPQSGGAISGIRLLLGDASAIQTQSGLATPYLAERRGDQAMAHNGWGATWVPGPGTQCKQLRLDMTRADGRRWRSGPLFRFCMDP